jgi:2-oxoglutarate ferredoxin oxidoreductase subunit alpha
MNYNILIGGAAGQGMNSLSNLLAKGLKRHGYKVFLNQVYMSRIRGGHNFFNIRFSDHNVTSYSNQLDLILALNQETIDLHSEKLKGTGVVLSDMSYTSNKKIVILDSKGIAKTLNHPKGDNMVLLGALIKIFKLDPSIFLELINKTLKLPELNIEAFDKGYQTSVHHFETCSKKDDKDILINGNTSIGLGAIAAGMSVFSAYPMTPSTSIMNYLIKKQKTSAYYVEQAEDEIAAIHIALGAAAAGARAMTASSGGGLALMTEALGLVGITETPLVIVDVMRPGPATGLPTKTGQSDLSFLLTASQDEFPRMIIAVRDVEDAFYQTIRAFDLSEKYQIPVIILNDQFLADAYQTVPKFSFDHKINRYLSNDEDIQGDYQRYQLTESGVSPRLLPGLSKHTVIADNHEHDGYGRISEDPINRTNMHLKRLKKLDLLTNDIQEPLYFGPNDSDTVLVGFGSVKGAIEEAVLNLNRKGHKVSGLIFGDVFPLPLEKLDSLKDKRLINIEMNATGQFARLVRMESGITFKGSILKFDGLQISGEYIEEVYHERF